MTRFRIHSTLAIAKFDTLLLCALACINVGTFSVEMDEGALIMTFDLINVYSTYSKEVHHVVNF